MKSILPRLAIMLCVSCSLCASLLAYDNFGGGCKNCHGSFTKNPYSSLKTQTAWPDSLHQVHRSSTYMGAGCGACHQVNGDATSMTTSREGYGCSGCHGTLVNSTISGAGLRQHHRVSGADTCSGCHSDTETANPESTKPPYYVTVVAKLVDPCNSAPAHSEDWNGDGIGLDNDGDDLYDSADPDCSSVGGPPVASFTSSQPSICASELQLTDTSTDPDPGDAVSSWEWDFLNDGTVDSTVKNPLWDPGAPGTFDVKLTVRDQTGQSGSHVQSVVVAANQAPTAAFGSTPTGLQVAFVDQSTDPDGTVSFWDWDFGDGSTSGEKNPVHTFPAATTYTVTLTVGDSCGAPSTAVQNSVSLAAGGKVFHRGDPNDDGNVNITDGIYVLNFLFLGGAGPTCMESGDPNDDGLVNITDGIFLLNFLFLGGPAPALPGPPASPCGSDPPESSKDLGCGEYTHCV